MRAFLIAAANSELFTQLVVLIVTGVIAPFIIKYFKVKVDDKTRTYIENAIQAAIRLGVTTVANGKSITVNDVLSKAVADQAIRTAIVNTAGDYLNKNVPTGLQRLGITGSTVAQVVYARLDKALNHMSTDVQGTADSTAAVTLTLATGMPSTTSAA